MSTSQAKVECENRSSLLVALRALERDPSGEGFSHLGTDGVWRNFGKDGKVFSYRALSPEEIKEVVGLFGGDTRSDLESKLDGVDGRDVKDADQLLHPGAEIAPPSLFATPIKPPSPGGGANEAR
ncbi:hypothetical protein PV08_09043 [Exophiala spinifera]|uniref:Uncharacterized protein n=1 Tax=Exophiala spinifera TaxID=91928 RepID=A0A0D1Y9Y4_9EURO|nr:uncharacterized protein PV08_09043 [Exophiala spinifera]KIW11771.1 hypothetical protein PV08_09043 [Exophiala spinifera]